MGRSLSTANGWKQAVPCARRSGWDPRSVSPEDGMDKKAKTPKKPKQPKTADKKK
jgi:hypothetical protein